MVENHYDFINIHHHKTNEGYEKILKEQGRDDSYYTVINGEKVCLPTPNLHTFFLLRHAMIEFAASGLNLRQVLDWGFHVKQHTKEIDWRVIDKVLKEYGMIEMFHILNAICIDDLGFSPDLFPIVFYCEEMKKKSIGRNQKS